MNQFSKKTIKIGVLLLYLIAMINIVIRFYFPPLTALILVPFAIAAYYFAGHGNQLFKEAVPKGTKIGIVVIFINIVISLFTYIYLFLYYIYYFTISSFYFSIPLIFFITYYFASKYYGKRLGFLIGIGLLLIIISLPAFLNPDLFRSESFMIRFLIYFIAGLYCGSRWPQLSWRWGVLITIPLAAALVVTPLLMMAGAILLIQIVTLYYPAFLGSSIGGCIGARMARQREMKKT